jgi:hypothetical protein
MAEHGLCSLVFLPLAVKRKQNYLKWKRTHDIAWLVRRYDVLQRLADLVHERDGTAHIGRV